MKKVMVMACLALFALTTAASRLPAQEAEDFGRPGGYIGGGFTWAFENFDFDQVSALTGTDVSASGSPGFDVRGGYRFNEYVALEGDFQYYANFDIEAAGVDVLSANAFSFFANVKGYPLAGRVQPYGLFGIGVLRAAIEDDFGLGVSESDAAFALRFGGGLDVYVTEHVLLNLDVGYLLTPSDMNFGGPVDIGTDLIPLTVGAQYRF